jgi:hypothetical protein
MKTTIINQGSASNPYWIEVTPSLSLVEQLVEEDRMEEAQEIADKLMDATDEDLDDDRSSTAQAIRKLGLSV